MASELAEARHRSQSRASTSSMHSGSTQPNLEHNFPELYGAAPWLDDTSDHHNSHHAHHQHNGQLSKSALGTVHPLTPEDIILHAASQLESNPDFSLDASMAASVNGSQSFHHHHQHHHTNRHFGDLDSQMVLDRDANDEGDSSLAVGLPVNAPKPPRSSANNELEMRQLFTANKCRSLQDVAEELHGNERGPNSERTRQVFAMLWINQVCSKGKGSVPRGRVYANYASRCATERITVLNPASFGKLVRVLFPGLKTRRLGVRGESKYHYVNFTLAEDEPDLRDSPRLQVPLLDSVNFSQNFSNDSSSNIPTAMPSKGVFAPSGSTHHTQHSQSSHQQQKQAQQTISHQPSFNQPLGLPMQQPQKEESLRAEYVQCLYNQPDAAVIDQLDATASSKTVQTLFLASSADSEPFSQSDPLVLPRIEPFLPNGTDPDAAKSLAALYRSHCTSLVECIRYCKEKTFFHLFTSFQGTLTMPVQKLFANPSVAPWIEESDFVLYQRMMRIISGLTLQVVPKPVLDTLRNISTRLVAHIRESFQGQPSHVVRAKEAPATIFAALLDRALRVNLTAHAAANMLSNPANRDQMYLDWITLVRVRKVAESIPARGMDDVVNLLISQLRELLDPVDVAWEVESRTLYGEFAERTGRRIENDNAFDGGASNVLDRWVSLLQSLPARFPYASHRDVVWCVERVGSAVMRDLTIQQGKSFGSWWVTKCWIDEMVTFLAEQGGFLRQKSSQQDFSSNLPGSGVAQKNAPGGRDLGRQGSRYGGAADESSFPPISQNQPDRAPFPSAPAQGTTNNNHDSLSMMNGNHDDSGIGIRTPDEDFPLEKYNFSTTDDQELMGNAGLH
ncbi:rfx dna-binding domain-containing protein [Ophiostoma piceae UAMH 11346]|uniref:Rfx dna-binding domain-containing protein n=1 Tax=Ophiostoma piceae (strain UAMH 11346) TaxID=1262450 RepID=S3CSW5_OPHP1|nr:rfx dna-binding domain-containing protein [Ophiostoma piceae UAMH 11346]